MNFEYQKEMFKNHIATLTQLDNITILDFKEPNTSHYQIRFLFENDLYKLHISGDLGELTATNRSNMTYERFHDFVRSPGYFKEKIDCCSRKLDVWDEDLARDELKKQIIANDKIDAEDDEEFEEKLEEIFDDIFEDFSNSSGLSPHGYAALCNLFEDAWEWSDDLGKKSSGIIELYLLAFDLATTQLKDRNITETVSGESKQKLQQEIREFAIDEFASVVKNKAETDFAYDFRSHTDCESFMQEIDEIAESLKTSNELKPTIAM